MCHFLSFVVRESDGNLFFGQLDSHSGIEEGWGLKPGSYREAEWTRDDRGESLTIRVKPGELESQFGALVLSRFPTRKKLLEYIRRGKTGDASYRYLSGVPHCEDGPAVVYADGGEEWYCAGRLHCEDGPAVKWATGYKAWYFAGERQPAPKKS